MTNFELLKECLYCGKWKSNQDFSDEHIWPDALGGNFLPRTWRTHDVCGSCNSASGVFVDGAFIKSWLGAAERASSVEEYLLSDNPINVIVPLNYMGVLPDIPTPTGETAELWLGPCGSTIIHLRPSDKEEVWGPYAGGDPRLKKSRAGRAYLSFATAEEFWIIVCLNSFRAHFKLARRFVVNADLPKEWRSLASTVDRTDPQQAADLKLIDPLTTDRKRDEWVHASPVVAVDVGHRMLAKVALALGYNLLGSKFTETEHALNLRRFFREANHKKRADIPVRGSGMLHGATLGGANDLLAWPGAWVLMVTFIQGTLGLTIITPTRKVMTIVVCDDALLLRQLDNAYKDGAVWITVPSLAEAVGPISLPDYLGHVTAETQVAALMDLARKRTLRSKLPKCRPDDDDQVPANF